MPRDTVQAEVVCIACGARQRCGPTQMLQRLADIGMLKRSSDPDLALLHELLRHAADRLPCHVCRAIGLTVADVSDQDEWDDVRPCVGCGKPIGAERLSVFPNATRCASCQVSSEDGSDREREFCGRCGAVMSVRLRRSAGATGYELKCPDCGR